MVDAQVPVVSESGHLERRGARTVFRPGPSVNLVSYRLVAGDGLAILRLGDLAVVIAM